MMLLRRSAVNIARRPGLLRPMVARPFTSSRARADAKSEVPAPGQSQHMKTFDEIKQASDLLVPGSAPGTVPTDYEQSTGLERLEILGKMQGVDIFDMTPLDASRKGTLDNPIIVKSAGEEQYAGCTGYPADSHVVEWLVMSRERPVERCQECGNVLRMEYVGNPDEHHDDHSHGHDHGPSDAHPYEGDPKTFVDFLRPEYR